MLEILKSFVGNPFLYFGVLIVVTAFFIGFLFMGDKSKDDDDFDFENDEEIELPEKVQKVQLVEKTKKEVVETPLTEDQIKARAELDRVIMQMEQDLNEKENTPIHQFEQEQEENAIISYQELVRTVQKDTIKEPSDMETIPHRETVVESYVNPIVEPEELKVTEQISLDDLELDQEVATAKSQLQELFYSIEEEQPNLDSISPISVEVEPIQEEVKPKETKKVQSGFHSTSFISPVFGVVDNKIEYPTIPSREKMAKRVQNEHLLELEKTLNLEPITEEIRKNDAFLQALKEFRKNLD